MKTRVLLCHDYEILPLLDGRQTVIIRPVVPQPTQDSEIFQFHGMAGWKWRGHDWAHESQTAEVLSRECTLGVPGDQLRVKEIWGAKWNEATSSVSLLSEERAYKASGDTAYRDCWRSPQHMPARYSRLSLEVVSVRVKQLKDLTPEDVPALGIDHRQSTAEYPIGCNIPNHRWYFGVPEPCGGGGTIRVYHEEIETAIKDAWESLYAKKGYPFAPGLWCWLAEVRRVEKGEGAE